MKYLPELFAANARWAEVMKAADPQFFAGLAALQTPSYLWIANLTGFTSEAVHGPVARGYN